MRALHQGSEYQHLLKTEDLDFAIQDEDFDGNYIAAWIAGDRFCAQSWGELKDFKLLGDLLRFIGMGEKATGDLDRLTIDKLHQAWVWLDQSKLSYRDYLHSPEWQETRRAALSRSKNRCQVCNSQDTQLDVHHRTYERAGNEWPEDLIVLCHPCHSLFEINKRLPKPPS